MRPYAPLILAALLAAPAAHAQQGQQRYLRLPPEVFDVTPPSERVEGEPGQMTILQRACRTLPTDEARRRVVDVAVQEWGFFGFPIIDATKIQNRFFPPGIVPDEVNPAFSAPRIQTSYPRLGIYEDSERVAASIAGYWAATPEGTSILTSQNRAWAGPGGDDVTWQEPWSAAFISWVMCEAGLGSASQFQRSIAHRVYIDQAIRARDGASAGAAYVAYDRGEAAINPGDLLCSARRPEYRSIADRRRQIGIGARSHCDVVVKVDEAGGRIFVIGGNVHRSVSLTIMPAIREAGRNLRPVDEDLVDGARTIFAHLKLRAEPIETNALDSSPTIKALACVAGVAPRTLAAAPMPGPIVRTC